MSGGDLGTTELGVLVLGGTPSIIPPGTPPFLDIDYHVALQPATFKSVSEPVVRYGASLVGTDYPQPTHILDPHVGATEPITHVAASNLRPLYQVTFHGLSLSS